jgi:acetyl-CoA carboxylase biotin carboxylase subunit
MGPRKLKQKKLEKVFVANRGEIAVRIIRACREMGIASVAAYSEADRRSLHVQQADEAVCVGPAAPAQSYLDIDGLVAAARDSGCDGIHPGYGFLAESPAFARAVEKAGLVWIGPGADIIDKMGSKIESRRIMSDAGVPVVPGSTTGSEDPKEILADAAKIEGPVFIKASAGGGGKGLRLVEDRRGLEKAVREAIGEAKSAFGDGTVYVEKQIARPRHIEFQILADAGGHVVHLYERECSIQRRHQKVLEETPSPALTPELREEMGWAAKRAAIAVGYVNAGTIEFMVDQDGHFYFLEMNTRIQVEHPITELITGIDLVQWQLRVARGEKLAFGQDDITRRGHAIECRVYAEDETRDFMPSCGEITYLYEPSGPGVRNDSGIYEGWEVSPHYDPILSKLVTYGENREQARQRMLRALNEYVIHGVQTGIDLHKRILQHGAFIAGDVDTTFFDTHADELLAPREERIPDVAFIAAALYELAGVRRRPGSGGGTVPGHSVWTSVGAWEIGGGGKQWK